CLGLSREDQASVVMLSREGRSVVDGPGVGRKLTSWVLEGNDQEACQLVEERLRAHGAQDSPIPAARLLGQTAQAPADVLVPAVRRDATAGSVLQTALARDVQELLFRLVGVPLDEDPEDVHRARVVTRRLRGLFRTFGNLLQLESTPEWLDELAWLADQLGPVRDADVMLQRLGETSLMLRVEDRPAAEAIMARLADRRRQCWGDLMNALRLPRCVTLLDGLVALASEGLPLASRAQGPAAFVLAKHTHKRWRRLKRRVKQMPPDPSETDLHRTRIAAKRMRYACETAALAVGEPATLLADEVGALQDMLGAHQDAVVLRDWLRHVARENRDLALAASELAGIEAARMNATAARWREIWNAADRKRLRRWMRR
ncbi:MAG: CHAD domain-containing protein, partial [Anaerolineae bacterium]